MNTEKYVRGTVRIRVRCRWPERVINVCAVNGVEFWDIRQEKDGSITMSVYISGYRTVRSLASKSGMFTVRAESRHGVPFFMWRIRKRYVLFAGLVCCLAAVWTSSFYVWQVEVSGNDTVSDEEIIGTLRKLGVREGTCVFSVDRALISDEMLLAIPKLSWFAVNFQGSRADVIVREKVNKPDITSRTMPCDITAGKSGIITGMTVMRGVPEVNVGDVVMAGDKLVSGVYEKTSGQRNLHAEAVIEARTLREERAVWPTDSYEKLYTGKTKKRYAVIFCGKRINLYFSGGNIYNCYDKMIVERCAVFPGNGRLPLSLITETYTEYRLQPVQTDEAKMRLALETRLRQKLSDHLEKGYAEKTDVEFDRQDGKMTARLTAQCIENIASETPVQKTDQ